MGSLRAGRPPVTFEITPALLAFRQTAGDANRVLNTILVGLETLKFATPVIPADLVLTWHLPSNTDEWEQARAFALRSAMIAVVDGLDQFMRILTRIEGLVDPGLDDVLNGRAKGQERRPTVAERIERLAGTCPGAARAEHVAAMHLLAIWRNRFAHKDYRFGLPPTQRTLLVKAAPYFLTEHGGADIVAALKRFDDKAPPTLGDLSTLIASAHRLVTKLDGHLLFQQKPKEYASALVRFLMVESGNPAAFIDEVWRDDSHSSVGAVYARLQENGADHNAPLTPGAMQLTSRDMDDLFGYGRNQAGQVFGVALGKRPIPVRKRLRNKKP